MVTFEISYVCMPSINPNYVIKMHRLTFNIPKPAEIVDKYKCFWMEYNEISLQYLNFVKKLKGPFL